MKNNRRAPDVNAAKLPLISLGNRAGGSYFPCLPRMKKLLAVLLSLLLGAQFARAQLASFGDVPIEINANTTQFVGGIAIAQGHVIIQYGSITIYCDYGQYNPDTHDVLVRGNVRIYRNPEASGNIGADKTKKTSSNSLATSGGGQLFIGERAVYNLETKQLRGADFRGDSYPFRFAADTLSSTGPNAFTAKDAIFTTSDSSQPDYYIKAKSVRIYPKNRIIFTGATLYVGKTPVFWFPYLFQSLEHDTSFSLTPGYLSQWGAFLLGQYSFPIAQDWEGKIRLDLRSTRGVAVGFESRYKIGGEQRNWGRFRSYYAQDAAPYTNHTALGREDVNHERYRVSLQQKLYITDDVYANVNINKLSDAFILQDFLRNEFRLDPQPDNVISLTKWDNDYTATLIGRKQLNNFFDATERLPEFALDIKRQALFDSPIFYQGESGIANLRRNFSKFSGEPDYRTVRLDTFHEILYPTVLGGWLSFIPRIGIRGTYYTETGHLENEVVETTVETILPNSEQRKIKGADTENQLHRSGSAFRGIIEGGFESSFKFSREWNDLQSRTWGLDGLRHIVKPYMDVSLLKTSLRPDNILQFDRFQHSTQLPVFDFPQFTAVDAIDNWAIVRLGVHNNFQTRRDNNTYNWFTIDSFVDVNVVRPNFPDSGLREGTISNLYNNFHWAPLPWVNLQIDSQVPTHPKGFTEVNSTLSFLVNSNLRLDVGHRYINNNPFFDNSSLISLGGYYRINDNWGLSIRERYEASDHTLESQTYEVSRDLSSWVAGLGLVVENNGTNLNFGVILTFTLKDLPSITAPVNFDPEGLIGSTISR